MVFTNMTCVLCCTLVNYGGMGGGVPIRWAVVLAGWGSVVVSVRRMEDHFVGRFSKAAKSICTSPNHVGLVNRRASCGNKFMFPKTASGNVVTRVGPGKAGAIGTCSVSLGSCMSFKLGRRSTPGTD